MDRIKRITATLGLALVFAFVVMAHAQASANTYNDATGGFMKENQYLTSAAYTTSNTGTTPVDTGAYDGGIIIINVTAVSGTSPSLTVNFNSCYSVAGTQSAPAATACASEFASSAITATGTYFIKVDHFSRWTNISTTITGTSPSFTMSIVGNFKPIP